MKVRNAILLLTGLLLAISLDSCRSHKNLVQETDMPAVPTVMPEDATPPAPRLDTIINAKFHYYTANFRCNVEGFNVTGQIRMVNDSAIWVSINIVVEVGRVLLTPTRAKGYVKIANKYFDGDYDELCQRFGIDLDYETIQAMIVGNCPKGCKESREAERNNDKVTLWYNQKAGNKTRQLTLTKSFNSKKITGAEIESPSVREHISYQYLKTDMANTQILPSKINLSINSKRINESTTVELERITLDRQTSLPFNIPNRYKAY